MYRLSATTVSSLLSFVERPLAIMLSSSRNQHAPVFPHLSDDHQSCSKYYILNTNKDTSYILINVAFQAFVLFTPLSLLVHLSVGSPTQQHKRHNDQASAHDCRSTERLVRNQPVDNRNQENCQ